MATAREVIRSVLAVVAGLAVCLVLVIALSAIAASILRVSAESPPTPLYLALNLTGGALAGAIGGATAMRIAPHTPHGHVWALALLILLLSLPTLLTAPAPGQPAWYGLALSVIGPSSVLLGGVLEARRERYRRPAAPEVRSA